MRRHALALALLAAGALGAPARAQRVDLGEELAKLGLTGDVTSFALTPEGTRAVFVLADAGGAVLASAALAEQPLCRVLSPANLAELDPALALAAGQVAFRARFAGETARRLLVVPWDGSHPARELALPAVEGDLAAFALEASGTWAVAHFGRPRREHLYALRVDGSAAPLELNPPVPGDREVRAWALVPGPRETRVVFVLDELRNAWYELFSVPVDRSLGPVRLNGDLALHGDVESFLAAPDGTRVAYLAEQRATDQVELFVRPVDGSGAPAALHPPPVPEGDARLARFTPDGRTLVFLADLEVDERVELHAAPADGSAPAHRLSGVLAPGGDVLDFLCAGNGRVLYRAAPDVDEELELYGVDLAAPGRAQRLSHPRAGGDVVAAQALERAGLVLYAAETGGPGGLALFASPLRLAVGPARGPTAGTGRALAPGLAPVLDDGFPAWFPTPDGRWLLLRARRPAGTVPELFLVPTHGPAKPTWIDGDPDAAPGVREACLTADGTRLVYRAALAPGAPLGLYLRLLGRPGG